MHMPSEARFLACHNHRPVDIVDAWVAPARAQNVTFILSPLSQPGHHVPAERDLSGSLALGADKSRDLTVEVDIFPLEECSFPEPRPGYEKTI